MRALGAVALEHELVPGDVVSSPTRGIYYVIGKFPTDPAAGEYSRTLVVSNAGRVFEYPVPKYRSKNYPFVVDGVFMILSRTET